MVKLVDIHTTFSEKDVNILALKFEKMLNKKNLPYIKDVARFSLESKASAVQNILDETRRSEERAYHHDWVNAELIQSAKLWRHLAIGSSLIAVGIPAVIMLMFYPFN